MTGSLSRFGPAKHKLLQRLLPDLVLAHTPSISSRSIALTFDDGPWPLQTQRIVEALSASGASATFFMLAENARRHAVDAQAVSAAGMTIGSHGVSHSELRGLDTDGVLRLLSDSLDTLESVTGVAARWYRPPYGKVTAACLAAMRRTGVKAALWSIDSGDCLRPPARTIADTVLKQARPGSIVLMHDGGDDRESTLEALPMILRGLAEDGYELVSLDDLSMHAPTALASRGQ